MEKMINEHIIPKTTSIDQDKIRDIFYIIKLQLAKRLDQKKADKVMSIYEHGMG